MGAGGKHALMGTHNRLLSLGSRRFLEVIAIDAEAPRPSRPRWFGLDTPAMAATLERGPALLHWVMRTGDIEGAVREYPERVEILDLKRGDYRWRIGVPRDGSLPCKGECPTLIQWQGELHPADRLPESGCTLLDLGRGSVARFSTPGGARTLPWVQKE
jgi:Glyoxalase-like domain